LNITLYFTVFINEDVITKYLFAYSIGGMVSFLLSPILFAKFSTRAQVYFSLVMILVTFYSSFLVVEINSLGIQAKVFLTTIAIALAGFFSSSFQSKAAGISSSHTAKEIGHYNVGTGLSGLSSNVISFGATLIWHSYFEEKDEQGRPVANEGNIRKQMYFNILCVFVVFVFYFLVDVLFNRRFGARETDNTEERQVEMILDQDLILKDTSKSKSELKIVINSFDILMGIFFLYTCMISIVGFGAIFTQIQYDRGSALFIIPFYMFAFNVGDVIGKYSPQSTQIAQTKYLHLLCFAMVLFYVQFFSQLLTKNVPEAVKSPVSRWVGMLLVGLLNGYLTTNFMIQAASRF
jgi:hypothetical protein